MVWYSIFSFVAYSSVVIFPAWLMFYYEYLRVIQIVPPSTMHYYRDLTITGRGASLPWNAH